MLHMTNRQARQFMLLKQGLLGEHRFIGKQGALDYVRQAGCIQFDPVDACGKNAELTLQSRVKGFTKQTLHELLYEGRNLVDFPDKNLSIFPIEDWPYFERYRRAARESGMRFPELKQLEEQAKSYIARNGAVSSDDLPIDGNIHWHSAIHWSGAWDGQTNAARAILEQLYSTGELVIHHKQGARKYYALARDYVPEHLLDTPDPLPDDFEHLKWRVLRRISAVGLLWNRPSDAWLNIWGLKSPDRNKIFKELLEEGKILQVQVEGIKSSLYCNAKDLPLTERVLENGTYKPRCEFLAPLDCFLWDRNLIRELFGFDYRWEIYTPAAKRKYGFYVLPVLYGERFVGRIEAVSEKKTGTLRIKNIWLEDGIKQTKKLMSAALSRIKQFARFNECGEILFDNEFF
ncbi:MAG: winged helix-turn-helix domain-containing protein [Lachnospiraceae bacterium]|nr:winged helix-turn-helix domain-containing protein [Lachnospiraceae bacterium]